MPQGFFIVMSFRSWLHFTAIGITLLASEAGSQVATENEPSQEESAANTEAGSKGEYPNPIDFSPALEKIESAIRDLVVEEDKISAEAQQDREKRDLNAQEGMARWAKFMFYATVVTVFLTIAALIAIIRTLHHTKRAADYTQGMLNEAKATTAAAQQTVTVSREIGEAQVEATNTSISQAREANSIALRSIQEQSRPFVVAVPSMPNAPEWGVGDSPAEWRVELQNHGPGTAFLISANAMTWTGENDRPPHPNSTCPMFSPGFAGQRENTVLRSGEVYTVHAGGFRLAAGLEEPDRGQAIDRFFKEIIFAWVELSIT